MPPGR
jgi:ABC-2 type transport system ATP-binding protein